MSDSKNNHYYIGGKLFVIPKEIANIIDETLDRITKEHDQFKAENERLRGVLREIANSAGKDACGFTSGEGHVDCIWKARRALKEVTK